MLTNFSVTPWTILGNTHYVYYTDKGTETRRGEVTFQGTPPLVGRKAGIWAQF